MVFRWLWSRGRRRKPLRDLEVITYGREGCHLCDEAWQMLERERARYGFCLSSISIAGDPQLEERYGTIIPVIVINGRERFWGRINAALLRRLLRSLEQKSAQEQQ